MKEGHGKFFEPKASPNVIYTNNSFEFGQACEDLLWNHCTSTLHRSKTNGIAERAVRRVKNRNLRDSSAIWFGWNMVGWFHGMLLFSAKRWGPFIGRKNSVRKAIWRSIKWANNSFLVRGCSARFGHSMVTRLSVQNKDFTRNARKSSKKRTKGQCITRGMEPAQICLSWAFCWKEGEVLLYVSAMVPYANSVWSSEQQMLLFPFEALDFSISVFQIV